MSSSLVERMVMVVSVVLVLLCTFSYSVSGLPFEKKAYLNETDGLLYVPGLGYDIPETHVFNGSSVSNRHVEASLALPSCGSGTYLESFCDRPRGGFVRCRNSRGNGFTQRFECASNEFCASFLSNTNQRRDQCVSQNYYIVHLVLDWDNGRRSGSSKRSIANGQNTGVSTFMASSDLSFYVTPNSQRLDEWIGNSVRSSWINHDSPQVINIGSQGTNRAVEIHWGISGGQDVNAYMAVYKAS